MDAVIQLWSNTANIATGGKNITSFWSFKVQLSGFILKEIKKYNLSFFFFYPTLAWLKSDFL